MTHINLSLVKRTPEAHIFDPVILTQNNYGVYEKYAQ